MTTDACDRSTAGSASPDRPCAWDEPHPLLAHSTTASREDDPRAEIGVLLVHGIGEHEEGDTLLSFGEPLIDWLREWLEGPTDGIPGKNAVPRGRVEVTSARMRALRNEAESPAYARVDVTARTPADDPSGSARERTERWLFAEAWWGDSVKVPAALPLLVWMLLRAPLLVYWHFHGGSRLAQETDSEDLPAMAMATLRWILSWATALGLQAVIVIAIVLWAIPIGPWRKALLSTVRKLAAILGDSFVLLEQDIQRATLVQRVRSALDWLRLRTEHVVVIAHSQGAAIAHGAIQASRCAEIRGYISVGSGLEKLELLRLVRSHRVGVWPAQFFGLLVLGLVLVLLQPLVQWTKESGWAWVGAAVFILFFVIFAWNGMNDAMIRYRDLLAARLKDFRLATPAGSVSWNDIHAGLDLVPMGGNSQLAKLDFVEQIPVTNEMSIVSDHVRYFDTRGDFASQLWALLSPFSQVVRFTDDDTAQLERLRRWHRARALGLVIGQCVNPLTALAAALLATGMVRSVGEAVLMLLQQAELTWPHRLLDWSARRLADGLQALAPFKVASADDLSYTIVGALIVLLGLVGWWMLGMGLWRASSQHLAHLVARGERFRRPGWRSVVPGSLGIALWTVTAMLPLLSVLLAHYALQDVTVGSSFRAAALLVSGLCWTFAVLFSFGIPLFGLERPAPGAQPDSDHQLGLLAVSLFGGPFYAGIGYGFWYAGQGPSLAPAWLTALLAAWGGVIAVSTLLNRQVAFRPAVRWGAVGLYLGCLALGWTYLRASWPMFWPLLAVLGTAAVTLVAGFWRTRSANAASHRTRSDPGRMSE